MQTTVPERMTCVEISEPGGPEVLKPVTRPTLAPGPGEVLIKVAAGINGPDVYWRRALSRAGRDDRHPGLEVSGRSSPRRTRGPVSRASLLHRTIDADLFGCSRDKVSARLTPRGAG